MRCRTVVLGGAVILTLAACRKHEPRELGSDPKARESYSLGYKLGSTLKSQNVVLDLEWYIRGLREGRAGTASQVKPEELRSAVVELRNKALAAQKAGFKEASEKNRAAGEAFLEQNKHRDGVRVLPSGLQLKVLKEGAGKTKPTATDIVVVKYRGTLVDGTEFASTEKKNKNGVIALEKAIPAWREALPLMTEGSKWQVVAPPALAYGSDGGPGIGPDSTLVFEVELLGFRSASPLQASSARSR
jgi:FKBP-type peptidyl-prolyl cis-trans isomerase